jgi:hypothetical protein
MQLTWPRKGALAAAAQPREAPVREATANPKRWRAAHPVAVPGERRVNNCR